MIGIKQLAQHLNISIGTVSRALNGRPDVNEETRRRVLDAAAEFGYAPNQSGRSLRQGTTKTIGFMIGSVGDTVGTSDNFFLEVFDGLQTVLARHHLDLIVLPCAAAEEPLQYLQRMVARRMIDGLIISATLVRDPRIDFLNTAHVPFVALGRSATGGPHPWIDLDFAGVAGMAVDRLVAKGHRSIAVGVPDTAINLGVIFLDSYKRALARHGIAFVPEWVIPAASSEHGGYEVANKLLALESRPTAVILVHELMAIGLYRRLNEAGIQPGRDIAVIGFRESPQSRFLSPTLTCFRMSLRDLGIALGETLLGSTPAYAETYPLTVAGRVWPLQLVAGESDAMSIVSRT